MHLAILKAPQEVYITVINRYKVLQNQHGIIQCAKKTPSEEIETDMCARETRQKRRRAALNADLQCAVDAGIMTIEEAFKFNDTNISNAC